jgi:hypothetical protein
MSCNHNCNQGRSCSCKELPITMEDDFMNFDWAVRWLWTGFAWFGFVSMLALIAFFFGYAS